MIFTIPLRRAMVTNSDLPYPEGLAAAEVLRVGSDVRGETASEAGDAREGLMAVIYGALASAGLAALAATRIAAGEVQSYFRIGNSATGYDIGLSLALFGAGHLVGLSVGLALLLGVAIAWGGAVPILTAMTHMAAGQSVADFAGADLVEQGALHGRRRDRRLGLVDAGQAGRPVATGLAATLANARSRGEIQPDRQGPVAAFDRAAGPSAA